MKNGACERNSSTGSAGQTVRCTRNVSAVLSHGVDIGDLPGVAACAATQDGEIYRNAFGFADAGRRKPIQENSLFFIASMTKTVTHIAVMQLVEQGVLSLEDKAARYLPSLENTPVLDSFGHDGAPIMRRPRRDIPILHLLAYTAGFAYPQWNPDIKKYAEWGRLPDSLSYRARSLELPLVSDPGERWNYGINSDLLGRIVEEVSGERLDKHFAKHIFKPLEMENTFYEVPLDKRDCIVPVHVRLADGSFATLELTLPDAPEFYPGGVGLFSTASDYLALTRMLLHGGSLHGQRLLRAETVAQMPTNHLGGAPMAPLASCDPSWSRDVDLCPGQDTQWGLGFLLNTQPLSTGRAAFSLTWGGACNTFYWIDITSGVTGVFMTSLVPFCEKRALEAFSAFEASIYKNLQN